MTSRGTRPSPCRPGLFPKWPARAASGLGKWYPGALDSPGRLDFIWEPPSPFSVADGRLFIPRSLWTVCLSGVRDYDKWLGRKDTEDTALACEKLSMMERRTNRRARETTPWPEHLLQVSSSVLTVPAPAYLVAQTFISEETQCYLSPKTQREASV